MSKSGIVNVKMVITEEKILSNIEKIEKMINPNSKKQIVQLEDDSYFKDLIESVKTYLIEYPKKKNFPSSVYKASYQLVEIATNQFEENTKRIEELIRQREINIGLAAELKELIQAVDNKDDDWKSKVKDAEDDFSEDVIETLNIVGKCKSNKTQSYEDAMKLLNARVNNLESNLHIEIDMERIEDKSKALSYIGIEIADALKTIPTPIDLQAGEQQEVKQTEKVAKEENIQEEQKIEEPKEEVVENIQETKENTQEQYIEETTFEAKPSLWSRIKNSKFVKAIKYIAKIKIVVQYPDALPEGRGNNS